MGNKNGRRGDQPSLLSLLLDFGLFRYASLLRLPHPAGTRRSRQLQVEVSDSIHERDKKTTQDGVTRLRVEDLLFEVAHKFLVNRRVDARGYEQGHRVTSGP